VQTLHALDIASGAERPGSPQVIDSAPITINSASTTKTLTLSFAAIQNQRAGLALANSRIVIAWGGGPLEGGKFRGLQLVPAYQGYVMTFDVDSRNWRNPPSPLIPCFTTGSTDKYGAGLWQSGRAPVVDSDGYVYFFTGNALRPQVDGAVNKCDPQG